MPQHLKIEVGGEVISRISTSNQVGTIYDVSSHLKEIGEPLCAEGVDTGVKRQPQKRRARTQDFRDDFVHVRRGIAAAASTSDYFITRLTERGLVSSTPVEPFQVRLCPNHFCRGCIELMAISNDRLESQLVVGAGAHRVPDSRPGIPTGYRTVGLSS